jgi:tRNA threonylcarbamoyladenosine biosynthesis protein TsaE
MDMSDKRRTFVSNSPEETRELGERIGSTLRGGEVILLSGTLGSGKTTLAQGIARGLGVVGPVQSPSFVLERVHTGRLILHHFDFYRLSSEEIYESGLMEDLSGEDVAVIEWPERFGDLDADLKIEFDGFLPESDTRHITINITSDLFGDKEIDAWTK